MKALANIRVEEGGGFVANPLNPYGLFLLISRFAFFTTSR